LDHGTSSWDLEYRTFGGKEESGRAALGVGPSDEQRQGMACAAAKEGDRNDLGGDENFGRSLAKTDQRKTDPISFFSSEARTS
jgi:hypothetical protein